MLMIALRIAADAAKLAVAGVIAHAFLALMHRAAELLDGFDKFAAQRG